MRKTAGRKHYVPNGIWDDNRLAMQPLGEAPRHCRQRSKLQLYQVCVAAGRIEVARQQTVGKFSNGHGDFIAGVATGAVYAVLSHFVR